MDKDFFFTLLFEAIEKGNNISLNREKDKRIDFQFASRFFEYVEEKKIIKIDQPTTKKGTEFIKKTDEINVFFIHKGQRLGFNSIVTGFSNFQLTGGSTVPAMEISFPEEGFDFQRRENFRVPTPPLKVEIRIPGTESEEEIKRETTVQCVCIDISRGGIAISEGKEEKNKLILFEEELVDLQIDLDGDIIHMEGVVENKREVHDGNKIIFGIDFQDETMDKAAMKQNISAIMKYIMKRQREILFKIYQ